MNVEEDGERQSARVWREIREIHVNGIKDGRGVSVCIVGTELLSTSAATSVSKATGHVYVLSPLEFYLFFWGFISSTHESTLIVSVAHMIVSC